MTYRLPAILDEDLLPLVVFSLDRTAIRDVVVNGRWVVRDGRHPLQEEIVSRYKELHGKLWGSRAMPGLKQGLLNADTGLAVPHSMTHEG